MKLDFATVQEILTQMNETDDGCEDSEMSNETTKYRGLWQDCSTRGDIDTDNTDHTRMKEMMFDVRVHGEVHATIEDTDDELEVRLGTATWHFEAELLEVEHPDGGYQKVPFDRVVDWHRPMELFH